VSAKPFLAHLADYLYEKHNGDLSGCCIVFPNRRAGLFFRRYLSERTEKMIWSPEILGISEFITGLSTLVPADPVDLIFELYDQYSKHISFPEPVDEFWYWGEMMLADFDEIDKYMVDANSLFTNIRELRTIDEQFGGLEPEQVEFIRQFWSHFHEGVMTPEKEGFTGLWELLPKVYAKYGAALKSRGIAYEGLIYREVAQNFTEEYMPGLRWNEVIFAGFNALNSCEKKIFRALRNSSKALFFWDYDLSYLHDRNMEAGRFLRENLENYPPPIDLEQFNHYKEEKRIRIFDLPGDILQARTVTSILSETGLPGSDFQDTAVVLCDENLLLPVLSSIPEEVREINVTMGYPLQSTPVFGLADTLLSLQSNLREQKDGKVRFYYRDVDSVLNHQYIRLLMDDRARELAGQIISENMVYIDRALFIEEPEILIFRKINDVAGFIAYFRQLFGWISSRLEESDESMQLSIEKEYIYLLNSRLNKLELLLEGRSSVPLPVFIRLFRKMIRSQRIPFTGEPLAGLQIMGILETRLLDFRHVVLLSVNEDVMPRPYKSQSYIPWSMRYAYRMPSREDLDAIYAYYFHRLIQRAETVDLLYNSTTEGVRSGEMSRYIYQLIFSRPTSVYRPALSLVSGEVLPVSVAKEGEVMRILREYMVPETGEPERYLSPSALNAYIDCPLRFYFRYIAGIGEEEEVQEDVDHIWFGTLLHETVWRLYSSITDDNGTISRDDLAALAEGNRPAEVLGDVFREKFFRGRAGARPEGKNVIIFRVILKYIRKIISTDLRIAPLYSVSLENKFTRDLALTLPEGKVRIRLGGKIDRIDRVNGRRRVLDYKTGNAEMDFPSVDRLFVGDQAKRNKAALQTLLYAWLVNESGVHPGLYVIRNLFKEDFSPSFTFGTAKEKREVLDFDEVAATFEENLRTELTGLFSQEIPFVQTTRKEHCKNCDFNKICQK